MRTTGGSRVRAHVRPGSSPVYCTSCHHRLLYLPDVGWVDTKGAYDMCDVDAFANHWPSAAPGPQTGR